ncbi:bacteriohemerythrin [Lachnospiraceae bacterium C1.1]|nr:hemerythrin domain-containing protein [Lachnospiraceae bacterium C1.1]
MSLTFDWDNEMSVSIAEIDEHHKEFLDLGKRAEELMKIKNLSLGDIIVLHSLLVNYLDRHVALEEKVMEEIHYKRITPHKEAHRELVTKIKSLKLEEYTEDPITPVIEIQSFIRDVLWNHIYENDKDLGREYRRYQKLFKHMEESKKKEREENEKKFGILIKEDNMTMAYLMWDQTYRGNTILVNKEKNKNYLKLSILERNTFDSDLMSLAKAVQKVFNPDDIQLLMMKDVDEQLCIHLVPKYKSDENYGKIYKVHEDFKHWPMEEYQKYAAEIAANMK